VRARGSCASSIGPPVPAATPRAAPDRRYGTPAPGALRVR
jgi:hypothetical protein